MSKKQSLIALSILIVLALIGGLLLVSHGDGPVMGSILSNKPFSTLNDYEAVEYHPSEGVYLVKVKEFNHFKESFKSAIPAGTSLTANIMIVEAKKGTKFTGKWMKDGNPIFEATKALVTDQKGIISYTLEGGLAPKGHYSFTLWAEKQQLYSMEFDIE